MRPKQVNPAKKDSKVTEVVAGIKVIQTDYKVQNAVFEDIKVDRPVYVDKKIEVPAEWDKVIDEITHRIADKLMDKVEIVLGARLDNAITKRISEIEVPKIIEKLVVEEKVVEVERPNFTDVEVERPVWKDKEIINPVVVDKEVTNAVIADKTVINAIVTDQKITNAIIKDVDVERAVIREKVIDVIHPRYLKLNGEPE